MYYLCQVKKETSLPRVDGGVDSFPKGAMIIFKSDYPKIEFAPEDFKLEDSFEEIPEGVGYPVVEFSAPVDEEPEEETPKKEEESSPDSGEDDDFIFQDNGEDDDLFDIDEEPLTSEEKAIVEEVKKKLEEGGALEFVPVEEPYVMPDGLKKLYSEASPDDGYLSANPNKVTFDEAEVVDLEEEITDKDVVAPSSTENLFCEECQSGVCATEGCYSDDCPHACVVKEQPLELAIREMYPDDVDYILNLRKLLNDDVIRDEFVTNPREDLDQILPSRIGRKRKTVEEKLPREE